jgi:hypothetical protein
MGGEKFDGKCRGCEKQLVDLSGQNECSVCRKPICSKCGHIHSNDTKMESGAGDIPDDTKMGSGVKDIPNYSKMKPSVRNKPFKIFRNEKWNENNRRKRLEPRLEAFRQREARREEQRAQGDKQMDDSSASRELRDKIQSAHKKHSRFSIYEPPMCPECYIDQYQQEVLEEYKASEELDRYIFPEFDEEMFDSEHCNNCDKILIADAKVCSACGMELISDKIRHHRRLD